ncbi:MAG TPA: hypothetical protein EYP65_03035 [Armatimonadetes bacterium]|nr:hypothetical protein [Armatimonadota bacterium]
MAVYFPKAGKENTEETLRIAFEEAEKRGIRHIVVASTRGETGLLAAQMAKGKRIKVIVVTHNTGFSRPGQQEMPEDVRRRIEETGAVVYTGTMVLRGLGTAVKGRAGFSHEQIVADTLRMFGQGMKVVCEMAAMVADAGLVPTDQDIVVVAGTGRGADTAAIIQPRPSNMFFDMKVREILCKPRDF